MSYSEWCTIRFIMIYHIWQSHYHTLPHDLSFFSHWITVHTLHGFLGEILMVNRGKPLEAPSPRCLTSASHWWHAWKAATCCPTPSISWRSTSGWSWLSGWWISTRNMEIYMEIYIIPVNISQDKMLRVMVRDKTFNSVPKWGVMTSFYREIRFYPWPPGGSDFRFYRDFMFPDLCL